MLTLFLLACAPETLDASDTRDSAAEEEESVPQPAPLTEPTDGACPDFGDGGRVKFTSMDLERTALVYFPVDPSEPPPILFVWHPLGGNAQYMNSTLSLKDYAEENETIVIAPDSSGKFPFEFDFVGGGEEDLALYDDLRSCAVSELGGDIARVHTMGFSAGALWASFLGIHRGDTLASIMPWSGGTGSVVDYATPAGPFAALLTYGGESDTFDAGMAVVHFDEATLEFAASLIADGHFVVTCNHGGGHDYPPQPDTFLREWPLPHRYGAASPFADGDFSVFPDICTVFTGE